MPYLGNLQSASPTGAKPSICLAKHGVSVPLMAIPPGLVEYSMGSPIKYTMSLCFPESLTMAPIFSVMTLINFVLKVLYMVVS